VEKSVHRSPLGQHSLSFDSISLHPSGQVSKVIRNRLTWPLLSLSTAPQLYTTSTVPRAGSLRSTFICILVQAPPAWPMQALFRADRCVTLQLRLNQRIRSARYLMMGGLLPVHPMISFLFPGILPITATVHLSLSS
jgi:hypothetical protein